MKDVKVRVTEVKPITTKDGKKFTAYKVLTKQGKIIDCKFVKEVDNLPTEPCILVIEEDKCNVSTNTQYPVLWVKEVKEILPIVKTTNASNYFD